MKLYQIITALTLCFFSCTDKKLHKQWDEVKVDAGISMKAIFAQLDMQEEVFSFYENTDSLAKRTSDVSYYSGNKPDLAVFRYSKFNKCRAYFYKGNNNLIIDFTEISTGLGGSGFTIVYRAGKFYTETYFYSDISMEGRSPNHKIIYQKLTLDKQTYTHGDSLYGKVDFESVETSHDGIITNHFGKGHFRTEVE